MLTYEPKQKFLKSKITLQKIHTNKNKIEQNENKIINYKNSH